MRLERASPCKVNLLLNILGKRADGFHELETLFQPVALRDHLEFETTNVAGVSLTCNDPALPCGPGNLVHAAASKFFEASKISAGVRVHLEKRLPLAAGLGGGSGNAANTLLALNELFASPLNGQQIHRLAAALGSDVPFFLRNGPALGTGRGEIITPLPAFSALEGRFIALIHPGFGVSTPWAYQRLAQFPAALHGQPGRASTLISLLRAGDLKTAAIEFYNALEIPAFEKFPLLELLRQFLKGQGAVVSLMSGSGSTTFAIFEEEERARAAMVNARAEFGGSCWTAVVPLGGL